MVERETVFSTTMKYNGFFSFEAFYNFCYNWLTEETGLLVTEKKYAEKLVGDAKDVEVEWVGSRKLTDYFKFEIKVDYRILNLTKVEINQNGTKVNTNKGNVELKIKGILARDYQGKFERTSFQKFMRSVYEKWIIPSRIDEYEEKIMNDSDEFLSQAKAYLDLEGKR